MKHRVPLSVERLRALLSYDQDTGQFSRIGRSTIGKTLSHGYLMLSVDGKSYLAHRLAWMYCFGVWPTNVIDHIDRNKTNNAIWNLRDVSHSANALNIVLPHKDNKTGFLGVSFSKRANKYLARIRVNKKGKEIGGFDTAEQASEAYISRKKTVSDL